MIEALIVTALPVAFLAVLFAGGAQFRRRHIDMDGTPPVDRRLFYASKYLIVLVWAGMVLASWGAPVSPYETGTVRPVALCIWVFGFALLFIGRIELGDSFRIGRPRESTRLRAGGLFRFSRNPMYVGVYSTLLASTVYTLNPVVLLFSGFIIAIHHKIVLAEEAHLRNTFGPEYDAFCRQVRRYV